MPLVSLPPEAKVLRPNRPTTSRQPQQKQSASATGGSRFAVSKGALRGRCPREQLSSCRRPSPFHLPLWQKPRRPNCSFAAQWLAHPHLRPRPCGRTTHGSGQMRFAIPKSQWTCATYCSPTSRRTVTAITLIATVRSLSLGWCSVVYCSDNRARDST